MKALPLPAGALAAASLLLAGCPTVREGPASPPPAGAGGAAPVRAIEPQPAPIPQRDVPAGQSPLRKTGPDQPLVPAPKS